MIIKSATTNHGWRYVDHAESVIVSRTTSRELPITHCSGAGDYWAEDFVDDSTEPGALCTPDYVVIEATLLGGKSLALITNRTVYLLDDFGKTIERVN